MQAIFPLPSGLYFYSVALNGLDVAMAKNLYFSFDLKKAYIDCKVKKSAGVTVSHLNPNPLLIGVGFDYRF